MRGRTKLHRASKIAWKRFPKEGFKAAKHKQSEAQLACIVQTHTRVKLGGAESRVAGPRPSRVVDGLECAQLAQLSPSVFQLLGHYFYKALPNRWGRVGCCAVWVPIAWRSEREMC